MKSSLFQLGRLRYSSSMLSATRTATPASFPVAVARRQSSALVVASSIPIHFGTDPFALSISSDHPSIKIKGSFSNNLFESFRRNNNNIHASSSKRSHYSYADGPGRFAFTDEAALERHSTRDQPWEERGFTVGIGGPVGSGKTALVLALIKRLGAKANHNNYPPLGVVTNDIFTQEDAQFLCKNQDVLPSSFIKAVETGGCPHAAIREDVSANLTACEDLTKDIMNQEQQQPNNDSIPPLILCESGGDNLAANFSTELADLTLYVIDVAGGDKVPRKGGPGITQSDLLVINKIDLAEAVGADLDVMRKDADNMRSTGWQHSHDHSHDHDHSKKSTTSIPESGPTIFTSVKNGTSLDEIEEFIIEKYRKAITIV